MSGSGISWDICKAVTRSRQIIMPAPHHSSFFTGRMPFLPPNQQRQSTEGKYTYAVTHTHPFNGPFPGLPRWAGTRKVKPIWILLKQETVSGSGISRAVCKSAPCSRQITTPAPHYSVFYRPDALPTAQPAASKHWRCIHMLSINHNLILTILKSSSIASSTELTHTSGFRMQTYSLSASHPVHWQHSPHYSSPLLRP